jgi:hypothetical protein
VTQVKCYSPCVTGCNQFGPVFWQFASKPVQTGFLQFFAVFCGSGPVFLQFRFLETGLSPVFFEKPKKTGLDWTLKLYAGRQFLQSCPCP